MKPLSEVAPGILVIQIQAVCGGYFYLLQDSKRTNAMLLETIHRLLRSKFHLISGTAQ